LVRDVMTTQVVTVTPETRLIDAVHLMLEKRVSGLPVVTEEGKLTGILTESDLLRRAEIGTERYSPRWIELFRVPKIAEAYARSHGTHVADVMTAPVETTDDEAPLVEIVDLMEQHQIKRVPVIRDGKIIGIVSRADIIRGLARTLADIVPTTETDASIRDRLWVELSKQQWMPPTTARFTVKDGAVDWRGVIPDDRYRTALKIAAETTPGVTAVTDHLVTVAPAELTPDERYRPKPVPIEEGPGMTGTLP